MKSNAFLVAALDIGTSKINALIAECSLKKVEIIALGTSASAGIKKGIITNIEEATQSIHQAITVAEQMANYKVKKVYTGFAGDYIRSFDSSGTVPLLHKEVRQDDIDQVMQVAQKVAIASDEQFLHVLSQEFMVDNQSGIQEPRGMSGSRLSAKAHIVTGAANAIQNIVKCVKRCGVNVSDIILEPLASSQAVLTDDEKELGVCMIDIGGGTTDIALFIDDAIRHTQVLPVAGDHVTRDIAILLKIATETAEIIKRKSGHVLPEVASNDEIDILKTSDGSTRKIPIKFLAEVIGARYEELFWLARKELEVRGYWNQFPVGIVLTGGASHVAGIIELAEKIFETPVRQGFPNYHGNLASTLHHGRHATGVGLIYHACQHNLQRMPASPLYSVYQRMRSWLKINF